jgi:hypothetical protein
MTREEILIEKIRPMIFCLWNSNESIKAEQLLIEVTYYPKVFMGDNYPEIEFTIELGDGTVIPKDKLSKTFTDIVDSMAKHIYTRLYSIR